jgi:hypothetical protein
MVCLIAPLTIYVVLLQLPWDGQLPENAGWLVVVGGGIGAGAAYLVTRAVLRKAGFEYHEIDEMWRRR